MLGSNDMSPNAPAVGVPDQKSPASTGGPQAGRLRVFISYSRDDLDFADQLYAALTICGFDPALDRHDIPGGEAWRDRLTSMISEADTIVFVLSDVSAGSDVCGWEVDEALRFNKRLIPVICKPLGAVQPPKRLEEKNYVFFYPEPKAPGSGFGVGLARLVEALKTDFNWLRKHTHYLQHAIDWQTGGKQANRLLSGDDIAEAKAWASRRPPTAPELTDLHREFIRASEEEAASRASAQRQQLEAMAAAQAERETALRKAEAALKEAEQARRRKVRIQSVALVVVSALVLVAGGLGWRAESNRRVADDIQDKAANVFLQLKAQFNADTQARVLSVFKAGAERGNPRSMSLYGAMLQLGLGVTPDAAAAHRWFERAAIAGDARGMHNLAVTYQRGEGVAKDFAAARSWYERAAQGGEVMSMTNLGKLYYDGGPGIAVDLKAARLWLEKALAAGDGTARVHLLKVDIREAAGNQNFREADTLQRHYVEMVRKAEIERTGKAGGETAKALSGAGWYALLARDTLQALAFCDEAAALDRGIGPQLNRAHALLLLGRGDEARSIYLAHSGQSLDDDEGNRWNAVVVSDFAELKKVGLSHPLMDEIEQSLRAN